MKNKGERIKEAFGALSASEEGNEFLAANPIVEGDKREKERDRERTASVFTAGRR